MQIIDKVGVIDSGSRTIPEDGAAGNLSIAGGILLDILERDPCPVVSGPLSLSETSNEEVTMLLIILRM